MSEFVFDVTSDTFEHAVIVESHNRPVIVDFWAAWCGPCKALGPLLEHAIDRRNGAVLLAKLNVDDEGALAKQFQIRGIPAVKAFVNGTVVDEFMGVRDKQGIERFLDDLLPSDAEVTMAQAKRFLAMGQPDAVPGLLDRLVNDPDYREEAILLIARAYIDLGEGEQAVTTLDSLPEESTLKSQADSLRAHVEMTSGSAGCDERESLATLQKDPKDHDTRYKLAGYYISQRRHREALEHLLEILKMDRKFKKDGARRAMLAVFEKLGHHDDLVFEFRRQMQIYL
jgi:putative thioredoxin